MCCPVAAVLDVETSSNAICRRASAKFKRQQFPFLVNSKLYFLRSSRPRPFVAAMVLPPNLSDMPPKWTLDWDSIDFLKQLFQCPLAFKSLQMVVEFSDPFQSLADDIFADGEVEGWREDETGDPDKLPAPELSYEDRLLLTYRAHSVAVAALGLAKHINQGVEHEDIVKKVRDTLNTTLGLQAEAQRCVNMLFTEDPNSEH